MRWHILANTSLLIILLLAVLQGTTTANEFSVDISSNADIGTYLVDKDGFTLYYFANDAPGNSMSSCYGDCANTWPPFYTEIITSPSSIKASDLTTITREDGKLQNAYQGWPLYRYSGDTVAGDIRGHGTNDVWFVASLASFPSG
jgi:predicted lipoprotein with Yx(FWY)xxD motif